MTHNTKLRVLLIAPDFFSGIGYLARHIADAATDIDYYFFSNADIKKHKREFLRLVKSVDIVHWLANLSWVELPSDIDIHGFKSPNIGAIFHLDERLTGDWQKKEIAKIVHVSKCDGIHVISSEWQPFFQSKTHTPVYLAHPALNLRRFVSNRSIKRPRTPIRIGVFGLIREMKSRKRLDVIVDALGILLRKGYKFELVVQGPLWKSFEKDLLKAGIPITNLGHVPSLWAMKSYQYIDLYLCTSDIEGGPLTVLEALASGLPVISTPVGVAAEALSIGGGILVQKGNPNDVALAIAKLIDDPDLYRRLSCEATLVSENFTWNKIGKEYITMYAAALQSKKGFLRSNSYLGSPKLQRFLQLVRDITSRERFSLRDTLTNAQLLKIILRSYK